MRKAIKNTSEIMFAYCLGANSEKEKELIKTGKIRVLPDGCYELFSQEAVNDQGEIAKKGDYFKLDDSGYPYPNSKEWFQKHHRHISGDTYEQICEPVLIWQEGDPIEEEMQYLLESGKLTICPDDKDHYFNAFLWNAPLSAGRDATIVFYHVERDDQMNITDISFNFVAKKEFQTNYSIL